MKEEKKPTEAERKQQRRIEERKRQQAARAKRMRMIKIMAAICAVLAAVLVVVLVIQHVRSGQGAKPGAESSAEIASSSDSSGTDQDGSSGTESRAESSSGQDASSESGISDSETSSEPSESPADSSAESGTSESSQSVPDDEPWTETVYATTDVRIREQPNTDCEILGMASRGDAYERIREVEDWSEIDFNGGVAYIKTEFLTTEAPEKTVWDVAALDPTAYNFGYAAANRGENNVPTDWEYYENRWGEFEVDWIADFTQNTIYLTMDEGFGNETTIPILNTLEEKNVPVTFFITKMFADERPDLVQAILDHGHQMGNHTCTHPNMPNLSVEEQTAQIMDLNNMIEEKYGYKMKVFRYPEGVYSAQSLGLVNNLGLKVVFWSYAYNDYSSEQPDVASSLQKALDALHPGAIYLLHASSSTNAAMLSDFIDGARARGYEFGVLPLEREAR